MPVLYGALASKIKLEGNGVMHPPLIKPSILFSLCATSLNPCSPEGFSQTYFPKGGGLLQPPLWIINTEGHITLNLLPVYRYGHPLSIDTKISTNHYCMTSL